MVDGSRPDPPETHGEWTPTDFGYSRLLAVGVEAVLCAFALGIPIAIIATTGTIPDVETMPRWLLLANFLVCFATFAVHELLYAAVANVYGCRVSFTDKYNVQFVDQPLSRRQVAVILLAPTAILSTTALALLLSGSPTIAFTGFLVFMANTAVIAADILTTWTVANLPRGSVIYTPLVGPSLVSSPTEGSDSVG
ncbi:hypothetical protein DMJ13_26030 [halophilic archaeon]|nr:hypothetical protein DMJ13_26030 [halophilic archaeon]